MFFDFFKKKVPTINKIIRQYNDNVNEIEKLYSEPDYEVKKEIIDNAVNSLESDNEMLSELYGNIKLDKMVFSGKTLKDEFLVEQLLIPMGRTNRVLSLEFSDVDFKKVNETVGKDILRKVELNVDEDYHREISSVRNTLQKRNKIKSSRLKKGLKKLMYEKQIKKSIAHDIRYAYKEILPTTYLDFIDSLDIETMTVEPLKEMTFLKDIFYYGDGGNNEYYQTVAMVPWQYTTKFDKVGEKYTNDMLQTGQISVGFY